VFWLALGYWTYRDAKRRLTEPLFIGLSTVVGLIPPYIGPLIYRLFRPPESLDDKRARELEERAIEDRLGALDVRCPVCHAEVEANYLVCPVCTTKLKQACTTCSAPLEPIWQVCPYCETAIERPKAGAPPTLAPRRASSRSRAG